MEKQIAINTLLEKYDFVVQIRNFNFSEENWREAFSKEMKERGHILINGKVFDSPSEECVFANFEFLNKEEVLLPDIIPAFECPFVQSILGYYCVKFNWNTELDSFDSHFRTMIIESMGIRFAKKEGELIYYPCVAELEQEPDFDKYDYDSGHLLLCKNHYWDEGYYHQDYHNYIFEKLRSEFHKHNYDVHFCGSSKRNPYVAEYFIKTAGEYASELCSQNEIQIPRELVDKEVLRIKVKLWLFNFYDAAKKDFYHIPDQHIYWENELHKNWWYYFREETELTA